MELILVAVALSAVISSVTTMAVGYAFAGQLFEMYQKQRRQFIIRLKEGEDEEQEGIEWG